MKVLVTGGTGFIGSHTAVALLDAGHQVHLLDNLVGSKAEVADRIKAITGTDVPLTVCDLRDADAVRGVLVGGDFDAVIHFAGLKAVGDSVAQPVAYYDNNLGSTLTLLQVMQEAGVHRLIFSSSATVYGSCDQLPVPETAPVGVGITNPYGQTKFMGEQILRDTAAADPRLHLTTLRYFNPVGAHPSGLIGEDPLSTPTNLLPFVAQVAAGLRPEVVVHGDDYPTPDGTGVRDYIHVVDLAAGHLAALERSRPGFQVYNLGTGRGHSVLEVVAAFAAAAGGPVPHRVGPRRPGDIATSYADPALAERELGWTARLTLEDACRDAWRWQTLVRAEEGRS